MHLTGIARFTFETLNPITNLTESHTKSYSFERSNDEEGIVFINGQRQVEDYIDKCLSIPNRSDEYWNPFTESFTTYYDRVIVQYLRQLAVITDITNRVQRLYEHINLSDFAATHDFEINIELSPQSFIDLNLRFAEDQQIRDAYFNNNLGARELAAYLNFDPVLISRSFRFEVIIGCIDSSDRYTSFFHRVLTNIIHINYRESLEALEQEFTLQEIIDLLQDSWFQFHHNPSSVVTYDDDGEV